MDRIRFVEKIEGGDLVKIAGYIGRPWLAYDLEIALNAEKKRIEAEMAANG